MNATDRRPRRVSIGAMPGPEHTITPPRRGRVGRLLAMLILGGAPLAAQAQFQFLTTTNRDGTLTIRGSADCPAGALVIPETIGGRQVTSIDWGAFSGCTELTSVRIPGSVTDIGVAAFANCTNLISVTMPDISYIAMETFFNCPSLTSITIPNSVILIQANAFRGCIGLTNLVISSGVWTIETSAFYGCTGLTSIVIPGTVESLSGFSHCTGLTNITIPDSVIEISAAAFAECTNLTSIAIPRGVTSIGNEAFFGCTSLSKVTIPGGVNTIGSWAFSACTGLTGIDVDPANSQYTSVNGVLFDKRRTTLMACPGRLEGSYVIPSTVTRIQAGAFKRCTSLTSVTIPDNVDIEGQAFSDCTNLTSVTIPAWALGFSAFSGCTSLTNVILSNQLRVMNAEVFSGCTGLTSILLPASVRHLLDGAFAHCSRLAAIDVDPENPYFSSIDHVLFDKPVRTLLQCPEGRTGAYAIPSGITSIRPGAFGGCTGLTSVTIPASVTAVQYNEFANCPRLNAIDVDPANSKYRSVDGVLLDKRATTLVEFPEGRTGTYTIPDGVTGVGNAAFANCSGLISVTIPISVTNISADAFASCSGLITIAIPDSVTSIDGNAFRSCTGLTSVNIPDSVTVVHPAAFSDCTGLTHLVLGDGLSTIEHRTFLGCTSLSNVTFGKSITSIGNQAFSDCTGLSSITIPGSVTTIGEKVFGGCVSLKAAYFAGDRPEAPGADAFKSEAGGSSPTIVYHLPGAKGWTTRFAGRPTAPWVLPNPTLLDFGDRFGPSNKGFSFVISWATNVPVVVEATADIGAGWTSISTNTLTDGWIQFIDPDWNSHAARFYRVRGQ